MVLNKSYNMRNKNLENNDEIDKMNGKRRINGIAFYDILENPDYRMRFEYADPIGMDNDGNLIFDDDLDQASKLSDE